ncbi:MAG: hypothetical protein KOO69_05270 [Victivallales bacterium]|nr:hypothetical protein [Victivallales bacterium]
MIDNIEKLEQQLDSFNSADRKGALLKLKKLVEAGEICFLEPGKETNLHFHTFYSYNYKNYSPSKIAWLARKAGLGLAGIVDFDVFDGLEEFLEAGKILGLKVSAGMESRVFVPEFEKKAINSPGEPGIAYHMGIGFPDAVFGDKTDTFKEKLRDVAQKRNLELMLRVNKYLSPVELDYEKDVIPLTPSGNATERHICLAYSRKARAVFGEDDKLISYWSEKLGEEISAADLPESKNILNLIRQKTMKQGGVGYVMPDAGSFPNMADMNSFVLAAGGIPTLAWLDGSSDGEQDLEELLKIAMSSGVAAVNIVPDRNYTPGLGDNDLKCKELYKIVDLTKKLNLPLIAGTEMNSPGQKFVDDYKSTELSPLQDEFLKGSYIVYAHSVLQKQCGLGYTGQWAEDNFQTIEEKNNFFEEIGKTIKVGQEKLLKNLSRNIKPEQILAIIC